MTAVFGTLLSIVVLALVPWPFMDLWFRSKGGMTWFFRAKSPPKALTFARLTYGAMLSGTPIALAMSSNFLLSMVVVTLFAHIACLLWLKERPR